MIVGLRTAAGEDDLLRARADQGGDLFARGFDGCAGLLTRGVNRSGVCKFHRKIGKHGVEHFRLDGRGGVEIKIDAVHMATHRILRAGNRRS